MVERARNLVAKHGFGNVELLAGDTTNAWLQDMQFDAVVMNMALHHLSERWPVKKSENRAANRQYVGNSGQIDAVAGRDYTVDRAGSQKRRTGWPVRL